MKSRANRVRIMHVITGLDTGGAEMMLTKLVCARDRQRFDIVVVSLTGRGTLGQAIEACGAKVYVVGMRQGRGLLGGLLRIVRLIRQLKPDLIMGWMYHANIAALLAKILVAWKTPLLWNVRHTPYDLGSEKKLTSALIRLGVFLSALPVRVVYNSQVSLDRHEKLGFRKGNGLVIPNGFDTELFKPSSIARIRIRAELGVSESTPLLGHVARFHPMKDHEGFLRAASLVSVKIPEAKFVLVGRDVSWQNPLLCGWIESFGIKNKVILLGERADLAEVLSAFDVLCLSSAWGEGFPNIIGEAMACGVACVTTNVGDASMIVGKTGRVVAPRDPESLADACCDLLTLGLHERQALVEAARRRVVKDFSLAAVVDRYQLLFDNVLGLSRKV